MNLSFPFAGCCEIIFFLHLIHVKKIYMKLTTFISAGAFIFLSAFIMKKDKPQQETLYGTKWLLKKIHTGNSTE
jgi:hypothetical protein